MATLAKDGNMRGHTVGWTGGAEAKMAILIAANTHSRCACACSHAANSNHASRPIANAANALSACQVRPCSRHNTPNSAAMLSTQAAMENTVQIGRAHV